MNTTGNEITRLKLSDLYFKHLYASWEEINNCVQARIDAELHVQSLRK